LKLLFDANLSPKLVGRLRDLFPGSAHVFDTSLARSTPDDKIWEYALVEGFTIVTADSDFLHLAKSQGAPPKIVHLENCDYRTSQVESLLRALRRSDRRARAIPANHADDPQQELSGLRLNSAELVSGYKSNRQGNWRGPCLQFDPRPTAFLSGRARLPGRYTRAGPLRRTSAERRFLRTSDGLRVERIPRPCAASAPGCRRKTARSSEPRARCRP